MNILPKKTLSLNCIVFPVVIKVHLYITGGNINFVTTIRMNAVVVSLFFVVVTTRKLF